MKVSRVLLMVSAVAVGVPGAAMAQGKSKAAPGKADNKLVQRGEYLVKITGCNECHTPMMRGPSGPPSRDMSKMLSGHPESMPMPPPPAGAGPWAGSFAGTTTAYVTPLGIAYAANLTPDPETGIGNWTEEQFDQAMKTGKHMGQGRPILPPMPWNNLASMTDEDRKAVFVYLKSLPPVKNKVPPSVPAAGGPPGGAGGPPGGGMAPPPGGAGAPPGGMAPPPGGKK